MLTTGSKLFLGATVLSVVAAIVFGLSRSFPLSIAAYMVAGMADQVSVVMRQTTIQLATPDALRGRVSSVNMIAIAASNQLGAVESGFVAAAPTIPLVAQALERAWERRADWPAMGRAARQRVESLVPQDPVARFCERLLTCARS